MVLGSQPLGTGQQLSWEADVEYDMNIYNYDDDDVGK